MAVFQGDEMAWPDTQVQIGYVSNPPPNVIVVHWGGNDITYVKQGKLIGMIKKDIYYMASIFPSANIVWSDILPRLFWSDIDNTPKIYGGWIKRENVSTGNI